MNILPSNSFMSCLDYRLEYSTGEFQALQLIVIAMFGAVCGLTACLLYVGPLNPLRNVSGFVSFT